MKSAFSSHTALLYYKVKTLKPWGIVQPKLRSLLDELTFKTNKTYFYNFIIFFRWATGLLPPVPLSQDTINLIKESLYGHFIDQLVKWNASEKLSHKKINYLNWKPEKSIPLIKDKKTARKKKRKILTLTAVKQSKW